MRKITRKQAFSNLQCLFDDFFKTYFNAPKETIDETFDNARFYEQQEKLRKAVYSVEYKTVLGQLDSESFRKYYEKVGEFAKAYKIDMRLFTEATPALIEDINDVLKESPNIAEKLDLINGFTDEELRTERISFDTRTALMEDLLGCWFVGDDKEQGINRMLMSLTAEDRLAFVNKISTDRKFLNRLIQCVNGREKDEMLAVLGEIFIGTGLANESTGTVIDNGQSDKIEASYNNGRVSITVLQGQGGGARDYRMTPKARYTVNAFENISMYYDGRLINVPALLLLNSWSNSMAEPEGLFYNYRHEDIAWNSLSDEEKDKYFFDYVKHYLPSGFVEALGSPLQMVITGIITIGLAIGTGGASAIAELEIVLGAAGLALTGISVYGSIRGIMAANEMKASATTMHKAKKAAKVMAQNIAQLSVNVVDLLFTAKDLIKGIKSKNAKIKNETSFANQSQIDAVSGVKEPNMELINADQPHDYTMKSNYGEMKTDIDLEQNGGYQRVSDFRVTSLKDKGHHGIDGIYRNMNPPPDFIIVDSKYLGMEKALNEAFVPTMSKVKNGRQMDSDWIKKNLQGSITDEQLLEEIRTAIRRKRVDSVAAKIDNTGKLTYYQLDNDGKVMLDKITNSPIIYNINKE